MKMQTRRHSHKSELAWKKPEEVRYVLVRNEESTDDPYWFDVIKFDGEEQSYLGILDGHCFKYHSDIINELLQKPFAIEVTASDLPYLEKPDVAKYGEMEFRKVEDGGSYLTAPLFNGKRTHGVLCVVSDATVLIARISGYRWCKPRKVTCPHCNGTGEI